MNRQTRSALAAVNRRFYDRFASDFDASRRHPWPGWRRVADHIEPDAGRPTAVLDVGCGNGRFGAFLAGRLKSGLRYLGLDACDALLRAAADKLEGRIEAELRRIDVLEGDHEGALGDERFDLVALFGVMHHVPGFDARRSVLRQLGSRLLPGGVLAASIWRLDRTPGFDRRLVPWEDYNRTCRLQERPPIDLEQLEPGGALLSWAGDTEHPRYCHFPDNGEIDALVAAVGAPLVDRFEADGRTGRDNLYLVWRREGRLELR